jgi:hypothetical protein
VFVVETADFNDKTKVDLIGSPHSEALHVIERFHRRDFGHMDVEMTFDDPKMYTSPLLSRSRMTFLPNLTSSRCFATKMRRIASARPLTLQRVEAVGLIGWDGLDIEFRSTEAICSLA